MWERYASSRDKEYFVWAPTVPLNIYLESLRGILHYLSIAGFLITFNQANEILYRWLINFLSIKITENK